MPTNDVSDRGHGSAAVPANSWKVLALQAGFVTVIAFLGGLVTRTQMDWYHSLVRPAIVPPDWAFGPAWTVFFVLMTAAAWVAWRRLGWPAARVPMIFWVVQLLFNFLWSAVFFGLHMIPASFFVSLFFIAAVVLTAKSFFAADRLAGWLMVPVCLWVVFASVLSLTMWIAN